MSPVVRVPVRWPDRRSGPWQLHLGFAFFGGRVEFVSLQVEPLDPSAGPKLTSDVLRAIPVATLADEIRLDGPRELMDLAGLGRWVTVGEERDAGLGLLSRVGRPRKHDYAEVARVYAAAPTKPTKAVAQAFDVPIETARNMVASARRRGFLEPTTRGRRSGMTAPGSPSPRRELT